MKRIVPIVIVGFIASGCASHPPFERPAVTTPSGWSAKQITDARWPEPDWWRAFEDPALDTLAAAVLARNNELEAAAARVDQARAAARIVGAGRYPFVTGGIATERTFASRSSGNAEREHRATVQAGFAPDVWERFANLTRAADAQAVATGEAERVLRLTLLADAATLHFQRAMLTERITLVRATITTATRIDELAAARHSAGAVSGLDRAQSRTNLATIRAGLPPILRAHEDTANALAVLTGEIPQGARTAVRPIMEIALPARLPGGLPSELLQRRPDIRLAEALLASAHADVGAARASWYPSVALTAETGFVSGHLRTLLNGTGAIATVGAALLAPVFQGDRLRATTDRALARQRELAASYRQTVVAALRDVESALAALEQLEQQESIQREAVEHASRALALAEVRYQSGHADALVLLTAQSSLLGLSSGLLETRFARLAAHVALFRALGGGL